MDRWYNEESTTQAGIAGKNPKQRRDFFKLGISVAGAVGTLACCFRPAQRANFGTSRCAERSEKDRVRSDRKRREGAPGFRLPADT